MSSPMAAEMETVKKIYAAINRNDIPAVMEFFDPDAERIEPPGFPTAGTYRGHAAISAHIATGRGTWAEGVCEPERLIPAGDKIVVFCNVRVRLKDHTDWIDGRFADGYTFRDGKVILFRTFGERQEALDWAGIKEAPAMRKLISTLFISLDGVVESPDKFILPEMYADFPEEIDAALSEQDAVLLGRKIYDEWSGFWPTSNIEPFASFINNTPKFVVSSTLQEVNWQSSTLISHDVTGEIAKLKTQSGKSIGVHGISLIQSLLQSGALDELRLVQIPVIMGSGRRLLEHGGSPIQLELQSSRATRTGLNYLVYTPRR